MATCSRKQNSGIDTLKMSAVARNAQADESLHLIYGLALRGRRIKS